MKRGMNLSEAADFLNVNRNTIARWIKQKKLIPRINYEGTRYFLEEDLLDQSSIKTLLDAMEKKIDRLEKLIKDSPK